MEEVFLMNKRVISIFMTGVLALSMTACGDSSGEASKDNDNTASGEAVTIRILENDTAKAEGYLDTLLNAFNEKYEGQIIAVDANMDEYSNLAENGPYGYGPDVIYQANDKLMTYAEDKHILAIDVESLECYSQIPEEAWNAMTINIDGTNYICGVPVNIQEPMFFYREDKLPENWETEWDDDKDGTPDFLQNWNDLYAYSKLLRDTDESANKDSQYGFMTSWNNLYLNGEFLFSYGAYLFGENEDGTLNTEDIGLANGDASLGMNALKQMAALMNEGCIDDTVASTRYEKLADGTYFCAVSTPDTYTLFLEKLALQYEQEGLSTSEAEEKAKENLKMVELPGRMPKDGDLSKSTDSMSDSDFVDTIVMGGVNGYGISSYTKYKDACLKFVDFATSYDMITTRMDVLGIAPTREDVAQNSGGITDMIFNSLSEGRIYLMPSVKAIDQVWTPTHTFLGDIAKDPFREAKGETTNYNSQDEIKTALEKVSKDIYDAIYTLQ